jgi:hypothetical protein
MGVDRRLHRVPDDARKGNQDATYGKHREPRRDAAEHHRKQDNRHQRPEQEEETA